MGILDDVTTGDMAVVERLDVAIRAVAAVVLPDPVLAAAGLLGCALQMLRQQGLTDEQILQHVRQWSINYAPVQVKLNRMQMHAVPDSEEPEPEAG